MRVSVSFKEVNSAFDQDLADRHHDGDESEDNIRYNWEDELEVSADVTDFKIRNNVTYTLAGELDGKAFSYDIDGMCLCDCTAPDGSITRMAVSRKLIKDTKKAVKKNGDIHFFFFLKDRHPHVNPMPGIYISKKDFPRSLPLPKESDDQSDDLTDEEE